MLVHVLGCGTFCVPHVNSMLVHVMHMIAACRQTPPTIKLLSKEAVAWVDGNKDSKQAHTERKQSAIEAEIKDLQEKGEDERQEAWVARPYMGVHSVVDPPPNKKQQNQKY